jgi:hypothetical protein
LNEAPRSYTSGVTTSIDENFTQPILNWSNSYVRGVNSFVSNPGGEGKRLITAMPSALHRATDVATINRALAPIVDFDPRALVTSRLEHYQAAANADGLPGAMNAVSWDAGYATPLVAEAIGAPEGLAFDGALLSLRRASRTADLEMLAPDLIAARNTVPPALRAGRLAEAEQLIAINAGEKVSFIPTHAQIDSSAFKVIVGDAKYTANGTPVGTIFDGTVGNGLGEIKTGTSMLDSSYQLRLQTYGALVNDVPYTIYTSRPVNPTFGDWLTRWGVEVKPLPKP